MELVDAHCHLDFEAFDADRDEALDRAAAVGVRALVIPGVRPMQWSGAAAIVRRGHPRVWLAMAVGVHPEHLRELGPADSTAPSAADPADSTAPSAADPADSTAPSAADPADSKEPSALVERLVRATEAHGAIAIGECGLDRRVEAQVSLERQLVVLEAHVEAAKRTSLPIVLHVVRRDGALLDALRPHAPLRGMVHAFSGGIELAREYVALGLHLSFGGALTRPNARRVREALAKVPADRVLLETDAPDQTPHGAPSARNEPAFLTYVRDQLSRPDVDPAQNAFALFGTSFGA